MIFEDIEREYKGNASNLIEYERKNIQNFDVVSFYKRLLEKEGFEMTEDSIDRLLFWFSNFRGNKKFFNKNQEIFRELSFLFPKSMQFQDINEIIVSKYLSNKKFYLNNKELATSWLDIILKLGGVDVRESIVSNLLTQKFWQEHEKAPQWIDAILKLDNRDPSSGSLKNVYRSIVKNLLTQEFWQKREKSTKWLDYIVKSDIHSYNEIVKSLLTQEFWQKHEKSTKWLNFMIKELPLNRLYENIAENLLTQKFWQERKEAPKILSYIVKEKMAWPRFPFDLLDGLLTQEFWQEHKKMAELFEYGVKEDAKIFTSSLDDISKREKIREKIVAKKVETKKSCLDFLRNIIIN